MSVIECVCYSSAAVARVEDESPLLLLLLRDAGSATNEEDQQQTFCGLPPPSQDNFDLDREFLCWNAGFSALAATVIFSTDF